MTTTTQRAQAERSSAPDGLPLLSLLHTPYWNEIGYPAISIPMGLTPTVLPTGLQLAGRRSKSARCSAPQTPSRPAPTTTCWNPHP